MQHVRHAYHHFFKRSFKLHVHDDVGQGPVVILLHGLASSSANWQRTIPLLQQNYRCITIDLLGFGHSPKPEWADYSIEQHVRSLRRTIRNLQLPGPYILVGHSLGSLLACRYARRYHREIARLVMLSPPVYLHPNQYGRRRVKQATSAYLRIYRFLRSHKKFTLHNLRHLSRLMPAFGSLHLNESTWVPFMRSLENCIETQTVVTDIAEVSAPVEVFYGSRDQVIVVSNLKLLASMRQVTLHEVKGASHFIRERYATALYDRLVALDGLARSK